MGFEGIFGQSGHLATLGGGLFGFTPAQRQAAQQQAQQVPQYPQQRMYDQQRKLRKKVISHTLSPKEAVNAAAKAVKNAQKVLT